MARVSGRNSFIAVPAGVICAAIVGALVWMSLPMVPVTVAWAGQMLRNATKPPAAAVAADTPAQRLADGDGLDCRQLYSDSLWNELTWQGRTLLDQSFDPPPTEVAALTEVLAPEVRISCRWTGRGEGAVATTVAAVAADAAGLAEAALRGQGFACTAADEVVRCSRTQGDVLEEHVIRGGLWLASVERAWHPEAYAARLEKTVFG
ncbi:hypothetical protein ACFUTX_01490 [Microbacterium sp. NPDC057407]|uniref:hypothetical protein n=1 Tax=Microbacterium sp. NPDC057407 TaxID=3346120 RepID=UPI00366B68AD